MKNYFKSDSGYSLGLVLIFVMAVSTVLGSVMTVTQLSADAQGRGVEQLKASNSISSATANVLEQMHEQASAGIADAEAKMFSNCGFATEREDVKISCVLVPNADSKAPPQTKVTFTAKNGSHTERIFTIHPATMFGQSEHISESNY